MSAKEVGIEAVSRSGKAALVTHAFEPRFALALVASPGEGGAKLISNTPPPPVVKVNAGQTPEAK